MITIEDRDDQESINEMLSPEHRSSGRNSIDYGLSDAEPTDEENLDDFVPSRIKQPRFFLEEILDTHGDYMEVHLNENLTMSPLSPRNAFNQIQNKRLNATPCIVNESNFEEIILLKDIPERLFRRGYTFNKPNIQSETAWIFNRISASHKGRMIDEGIREDISKTLEMLLNKNYEIMYIHTYQRWNFKSQISLADLWEIYALDLEYQLIEFKRMKVRKKLEKTLNNTHTEDNTELILKLLNNQLELKGLKGLCEGDLTIHSADNDIIDDIEQWLFYQSKGRAMQELIQAAFLMMLSPKRLAHNIAVQHIYKPGYCDQDPESFFRSKKVGDIKIYTTNGKEATFKVCQALALSLSNDPIILVSLRKIAQQYNTSVSTEPTLKGNSELNIYHSSYLTKRLTNVPINKIEDELWLRILEAEKNEQILVKVHVGWPADSDPTSLFRVFYKFFSDIEQKNSIISYGAAGLT